MIQRVVIPPVPLTFLLSLVLSFIALYYNPILGRDASLYIDSARIFSEQGAGTLLKQFSWPWFPALIGLTHNISGLPLIASGYLWIFLFTAGTCAVLVRIVELIKPEAKYWACLVILAMPAYNSYRHEIIREPGFWFFSALAVLFMTHLSQTRRLHYLGLAALSVLAAALFRLEAVFLLLSMAITVSWIQRARLANHYLAIALTASAVLLVGAALLWLLSSHNDLVRVKVYLQLINPGQLLTALGDMANDFAQSSLRSFSHDHAARILLFGLSMTILFNALLMMGPFAISTLLATDRSTLRSFCRKHVFIITSLGIYFGVLVIFFIQKRFIIDRYTSFLHILATPLIVIAFYHFRQKLPKLGLALTVVAVLIGLANVVSSSTKRTHYPDTANWISIHIPADARVFYYDGRIPFYAGRGYRDVHIDSDQALGRLFDHYDYFIVDLKADHPIVKQRLQSGQLSHLATFDNGDQRHLIILGKTGGTPPGNRP